MGLLDELKQRGLLHDFFPGTSEFLEKGPTIGYVGFDPTAPSLGIGNLVPIMLLVHFQRYGHRPIALVGGATGRIGDPSGKSEERTLLPPEAIEKNIQKQRKQLEHFLDFDTPVNPASIVNNYDWFKDWNVLDFLREVGKHFSINTMLAKDSVKNRMETGISFTEFSYQLIQGYDFLHLFRNHGCRVQFGGSDQWGNITAGTDLIRKMEGSEADAYAFTCPLLTKADGSKFGKSAGNNVWLDPEMTSPYQFFQFWLKQADADILKLTLTFSLRAVPEIHEMWEAHLAQPEKHLLQVALAEEMTLRVHGQGALERAKQASEVLFKGTMQDLAAFSDAELRDIFDGVPQCEIPAGEFVEGMGVLDLMVRVGAAKSKGEARRSITADKSVSLNQEKVLEAEMILQLDKVVDGRFLLVQVGKRNKFLVFIPK